MGRMIFTLCKPKLLPLTGQHQQTFNERLEQCPVQWELLYTIQACVAHNMVAFFSIVRLQKTRGVHCNCTSNAATIFATIERHGMQCHLQCLGQA